MTTLRQHWRQAALFVVLSCADLALTCSLVGRPDGGVYEANGLAASVLDRYGFAGLAVYKGLLVVLVAGIVCLVALYRPTAARRLTRFACAAVACVVLYSAALWGREAWLAASGQDPLVNAAQKQQSLQEMAQRREAFRAVLRKAEDDLIADRCDLPQVVAELMNFDEGRRMGDFVSTYRGEGEPCSATEGLAALVTRRLLDSLLRDGSPAAQARAAQLLAAYRSAYNTALLDYVTEASEAARGAAGAEGAPDIRTPRRGPPRRFGPPHGRWRGHGPRSRNAV
jgi:hypothetical protein